MAISEEEALDIGESVWKHFQEQVAARKLDGTLLTRKRLLGVLLGLVSSFAMDRGNGNSNRLCPAWVRRSCSDIVGTQINGACTCIGRDHWAGPVGRA